jgi:hypothetical protein
MLSDQKPYNSDVMRLTNFTNVGYVPVIFAELFLWMWKANKPKKTVADAGESILSVCSSELIDDGHCKI